MSTRDAILKAIEDNRNSKQMLQDITQAIAIRASADRLEARGDSATAILFRNAAWRLENGMEWLDDVSIRETKQKARVLR